MIDRPAVAFIVSPDVAVQMFRSVDMDRLRAVADVNDPLDVRDREAVKGALRKASIALTGWGSPNFNGEILESALNLKLIAHSAGSVKSLVNDAVYDRGIRVTTAAGGNAVPVAQFTVAMMVMMLKQVPWLAADYSRGVFKHSNPRAKVVRELHDMTVGLVGASRIGRLVIELLRPFYGLTIKLYDPYVTAEQARQLGVTLSSLEEVFGCEVVSVHAPNIPETRHMVNAQMLSLLPDHAVLINTSRGALIDESALIAEVRKRPIYVALDVTDPEPPAADSPLRTEENILITPHIAGAMNQARRDMGKIAIEQCIAFINNQPLSAEVTRAMYPTQA